MASKKSAEDASAHGGEQSPEEAPVEVLDPNAEIDEITPAGEQCPETNADGVRCLFEVHPDTLEHAFTEEDAERIEADGDTETTDGSPDGPEAAPADDEAGEANGGAPEVTGPDPVTPSRVSENSWWCPNDDTAMPHAAKACSKCGALRAS